MSRSIEARPERGGTTFPPPPSSLQHASSLPISSPFFSPGRQPDPSPSRLRNVGGGDPSRGRIWLRPSVTTGEQGTRSGEGGEGKEWRRIEQGALAFFMSDACSTSPEPFGSRSRLSPPVIHIKTREDQTLTRLYPPARFRRDIVTALRFGASPLIWAKPRAHRVTLGEHT